MTTDLERLHKVRSGELTGRGVGKTYANCYDVCEYLRDNVDGVVFWYLPKYSWQDYIMDMLCQLLDEFKLEYTRYRNHLIVRKGKVYFTVVRANNQQHFDYDVSQVTRGFRNYFNVYDSIYSYQGDN